MIYIYKINLLDDENWKLKLLYLTPEWEEAIKKWIDYVTEQLDRIISKPIYIDLVHAITLQIEGWRDVRVYKRGDKIKLEKTKK